GKAYPAPVTPSWSEVQVWNILTERPYTFLNTYYAKIPIYIREDNSRLLLPATYR
ncbi:unnamed protein product, partial [Rangifer tarandus platyrhynchus]